MGPTRGPILFALVLFAPDIRFRPTPGHGEFGGNSGGGRRGVEGGTVGVSLSLSRFLLGGFLR